MAYAVRTAHLGVLVVVRLLTRKSCDADAERRRGRGRERWSGDHTQEDTPPWASADLLDSV
eukprot:2016401-Rhodomonas_salina.1